MEQKSKPIVTTVCGGILREPEKYPSAEYQGQRVYFCTRACLRVFTENPEAFINGEVEHPVGDD